MCETCQHTVGPFLYNRCHGCNHFAHQDCHETMSIGVTWRVEMCIGCTSYVRQLLRIVRATEARRFRGWDEEFWFGSVIRACHNVGTMPESDYRALNAVQTYIKDGIASGLHVWQSHSLASPTERGDPSPRPSVVIRGKSPSPIGNLLPAAPPQGLPVPKAGSESTSAEQGGIVPSKGSGPVPPPGKGSGQRSEVKEEEGARGDGEVNPTTTSGRDAEIEELRQQIQALQLQVTVQNSSVAQQVTHNLPAQGQPAQGSDVGQIRQGVIPGRDQSGSTSRAGLRSKASAPRSDPPPGLTGGSQGFSTGRASELVGDGVQQQSRSPPGYSNPDENIWDQAYLSKALQQMKDSEISKLKFSNVL